MKLRYRAPSGGGTLELDDAATVGQLLDALKQNTGVSELTVKYGWPPQALDLGQADASLQSLGLQRESLTIVPADKPAPAAADTSSTAPSLSSSAFAGLETAKGIKDQNISVSMSETGSSLGMFPSSGSHFSV